MSSWGRTIKTIQNAIGRLFLATARSVFSLEKAMPFNFSKENTRSGEKKSPEVLLIDLQIESRLEHFTPLIRLLHLYQDLSV